MTTALTERALVRTPSVVDRPPRPNAAADQTRRLLRRWRRYGDVHARDAVVERHMPLAHRLARRYARRQDPIEDLVQVASLGLMQAVNRYDPDRGTAFSTFAVPTILGVLRRHFRDGWAIRVPRSIQERALRCSQAVEELTTRDGRAPTPAQIAAHIGASVEDVLEALDAATAHSTMSLDAPLGQTEEPGATLVDVVVDDELGYERFDDVSSAARALDVLNDRDRRIVLMRFYEDLSQSEIGQRVGISQMQVSRVLRASLDKLRDAAA